MIFKKIAIALVAALMLVSTPVTAQSPTPNNTTDWAKMFMDPKWSQSWSGGNFDADMFGQYMNLMLNPQMMDSMMKMANPAIMTQWMTMMTNPQVMGAMMKMGDPTPYMKWMTDPKMAEAWMKMGDPTPYLKMMTNPDYIQMMMKMADPAIMNQWIGMMTNPQIMDAMMKMMDPQIMTSMMMMMMGMMNVAPGMMQGMTPQAPAQNSQSGSSN